MSAGRKVDANNSDDQGEPILVNSTEAYDSWLQMPNIDMSDAVGGTLSFSHTWGFYYNNEGAYLEASTDGGNTWKRIDQFTTGGYRSDFMGSSHNNPYGGLVGWTMYSSGTHKYVDVNQRTDGEGEKPYLWDDVELDLTPWGGKNVDFRWRVAYSTDWTWYVNSWYRLDDVKVQLEYLNKSMYNYSIDNAFIDSRGEKNRANLDSFVPKNYGLISGDKIAVNITVINSYGDEFLPNNYVWVFNKIRTVVFSENFSNFNLSEWNKENPYGSSANIWGVTTINDSEGLNKLLYSGNKRDSLYPGSSAITTPTFSIPDTNYAEL